MSIIINIYYSDITKRYVGECNMIKTIDCDNIKFNLAVTIGLGKVQFSESCYFKTHVFRFNYFA